MGPRAGLDRCGKSRPTGIRSPDLPARSKSLYRLRYPGSPLQDVAVRFFLSSNAVMNSSCASSAFKERYVVICNIKINYDKTRAIFSLVDLERRILILQRKDEILRL